MPLEKPKLFPQRKTFIWFCVALLVLIMIRLLFSYLSYKEFIEKPFYYTNATVVTAYEKVKGNRRYQVLKLRSDDGFVFYTTSYSKENFDHARLRLQIFPDKSISFQEYLGTFYVKSKIKNHEKLPKTFKDTLLEEIALQHDDITLKSFYNAIFFATPLDKTLREKISMLGVSHLVALSGFHLSILWGMVYGLLLFFYRPFQQHYFPYRHALFDVGLVAMIFLGIYLWFVDFPPSLVRSYAMVLVGWVVLLLGIELLSFTFLATILLMLVVLFPSLLVSLSFQLSAAGVFYIFLLLKYAKGINEWVISLLLIPLGIFILMLPIVHGIFGVTNPYQLLSPILSLMFIPFYPLAMVAHLFGFGGIGDSLLLWLFALPAESREIILEEWAVGCYIGLSLLAIGNRNVFYAVVALSGLYMVYLFLFV
ncbi:MAG: ComEC/Rec2 family competence protein [Campylobacterota bacterium]|nr:ComEC/Rec2 family competence protein [Campylobacterota bacterium]